MKVMMDGYSRFSIPPTCIIFPAIPLLVVIVKSSAFSKIRYAGEREKYGLSFHPLCPTSV